MTTYQLVSTPVDTRADYTPYGGCAEFMYSHDREVIAEGPSETGKTLAACWKLHIIACKYPNAQIVIARAIQAELYGTVVQTWQRVIKGAPINVYGGEKPERYFYANGSVVWMAGLDKPGKALSAERDIIYVNQAEQTKVDAWEILTTRTTGRSAVVPF